MKCPVCAKEMIEKNFGGVLVDVCEAGCKGLFFEWAELEKLDEKNEGFGQALEVAQKYPRYNDKDRAPLVCPKCTGPMHAHKYHSAKEINVDECYQCGAFFLDSGELALLREKHMSDAERRVYADKLIGEIPGQNQSQADLQKKKERTEAVQKFTRFVRASYYVTGK